MANRYEPFRRLTEKIDNSVNTKRWIRFGVVSKVRKGDRKIRVKLLPELVETNWLRLYFFNAGDNYMTGVLPEVESEVVVMFLEGHPDGAFVLAGGFVQNGDNPASLENDYDLNIMDKNGNQIKMDADGITVSGQGDVKVNSTGNIILNGGDKPVARVGDEVATPVGPGKIVGPGNTKVLA